MLLLDEKDHILRVIGVVPSNIEQATLKILRVYLNLFRGLVFILCLSLCKFAEHVRNNHTYTYCSD